MRWIGRIAIVLLVVAIAGLAAVHEVARRAVERAVAQALETRASVGDVSGLLSGELRVHGLRLARHGVWRIAVNEATVVWSPRALLDRRLAIDRVVLREPRIAVTDRAADVVASLAASEPSALTVSLDRVDVADGRVVVAVDDADGRRLYGADRIGLGVRTELGEGRWSAAVERLWLHPRGRPIPTVSMHGSVKGRARGITASLATAFAGVGRADVRLDRRAARYRARVDTGGLDVRALVPSAPVDRVRGWVVARGRSARDGEHLAYTGRLVADGAPVGPVRLLLGGDALGETHRIRATAIADGARATGRGTIALDTSRVDARIDARADLAAVGRHLATALGGTVTIAADVRGPFSAPRVSATVDAAHPSYETTRLVRAAATVAIERRPEHVRVDIARLTAVPERGPALALAGPTTLTTGAAIELAPATIVSRDGRVTLGGRLGPDAALDLTIGVAQLDLPRLCATLDVGGDCTGTLSAKARITGSGPAPRLDAVVHHSIGADVVAEGTVPFPWPSGSPPIDRVPFALDLRTKDFDAATLQPFVRSTVVALGGRVDGALAVKGTIAAPGVDGRMRLRDGRLEPVATRVRYSDVELALRLVSGAVLVDTLAARADGTLRGGGRVALDGFTPGDVDLSLVLDRVRVVAHPAYQAAATGTLAITGAASAPLVRGRVDVAPATVRPALLPSGEAPIAPDPTIEVVGGAGSHEPPRGPPVADAVALDVVVRLGDAVVRRSDARIDLGGEVRVTKAASRPLEVHGDVRLVRGWLEFQERRFTVEPSTIRFDGPPDRPTLDVTARSHVGDYDVTVQLSGTGEKPVLTLASEPSLSQADVLAVLLFGVPAHELGQNQQTDLARRAAGLATSYVASGLARSMRDTLGLDVFDVAVGDRGKPGEVRVGRYVTKDVFLSLAQEFGTRVGQAAAIEYRVRPNVSVRVSTSTSGSSGLDVLWHRRY